MVSLRRGDGVLFVLLVEVGDEGWWVLFSEGVDVESLIVLLHFK